jgi:hypothetical protein
MALRRAARQSLLLSPHFRQLAFAAGARGFATGEQQVGQQVVSVCYPKSPTAVVAAGQHMH